MLCWFCGKEIDEGIVLLDDRETKVRLYAHKACMLDPENDWKREEVVTWLREGKLVI